MYLQQVLECIVHIQLQVNGNGKIFLTSAEFPNNELLLDQ